MQLTGSIKGKQTYLQVCVCVRIFMTAELVWGCKTMVDGLTKSYLAGKIMYQCFSNLK